MATIFLAAAIAVFWSGCHQAKETRSRLRESDLEATPSRSFQIQASGMTVATIGTGIILWSL